MNKNSNEEKPFSFDEKMKKFNEAKTLAKEFIASGESGGSYDAKVIRANPTGNSEPEKEISNMTIDEVIKFQQTMLQNGYPSTAVGKYQFLRGTLESLIYNYELDENGEIKKDKNDKPIRRECSFAPGSAKEKSKCYKGFDLRNSEDLHPTAEFNAEKQEKAADFILDRRGFKLLREALESGMDKDGIVNILKNLTIELTKEFSSLPVLENNENQGKSYWNKVGSNEARHTFEKYRDQAAIWFKGLADVEDITKIFPKNESTDKSTENENSTGDLITGFTNGFKELAKQANTFPEALQPRTGDFNEGTIRNIV